MTSEEEILILEKLKEFTGQWRAHGKKLTATAEIRYGLFIVLMVNEAVEMPSGCSIDKSVYILKELEETLGVGLFDRLRVAFREEKNAPIQIVGKDEFERLIDRGEVNEQTIVFNNLVPTYPDLDGKWEVPLSQSWHARVFLK